MNLVQLSGCIASLEAARSTPAGLPVVALQIEHESVQEEAGHSRQVKAQIKAVAFGTLAERIRQVSLGQAVQVSGFLANPKKSKTPVLHIQEFKVMESAPESPLGPITHTASQSIVHL